jgi:hypothetical protein
MTLMIPNGLTNCLPNERFPLTIQYYCLHLSPSKLIGLQNLPMAPYFFSGHHHRLRLCLSFNLSFALGNTVASYFVLTCFTFHQSIKYRMIPISNIRNRSGPIQP